MLLDRDLLLESDGNSVGLKHKAADISRSQYEVFATKHNSSEATVDESLGMLRNVCT